MSEPPGDMRESLDRYRAVRRQLEEEILPLATSVDGRRFSYQASLHGLELQPGSYVVLEQGSDRRLGQVVTLEVAPAPGARARHGRRRRAARRAQVVIRGAEGEGRVLDGDGSSFHDATVRPATADEVRDHLEQTAPRRARLEVGELLLAPGVPFVPRLGRFRAAHLSVRPVGLRQDVLARRRARAAAARDRPAARRARSELRLRAARGAAAGRRRRRRGPLRGGDALARREAGRRRARARARGARPGLAGGRAPPRPGGRP